MDDIKLDWFLPIYSTRNALNCGSSFKHNNVRAVQQIKTWLPVSLHNYTPQILQTKTWLVHFGNTTLVTEMKHCLSLVNSSWVCQYMLHTSAVSSLYQSHQSTIKSACQSSIEFACQSSIKSLCQSINLSCHSSCDPNAATLVDRRTMLDGEEHCVCM